MNLANIDNKFKNYDLNKNMTDNSLSVKQADNFQ